MMRATRSRVSINRTTTIVLALLVVVALGLAVGFRGVIAGVAETVAARLGVSGSQADPSYRETNFLMDTVVQVTVWGDPKAAAKAGDSAFAAMKEVASWSDAFAPESEISRFNAAAGKEPVKVNGEFLSVLEQSLEFGKVSDGSFDVTIGPVIRLWGFGGENPKVPAPDKLKAALKLVGYQKVRVNRAKSTVFLPEAGMLLDLGAVAKGYAVDRAGEALRRSVAQGRIKAGLINAGGDVLVVGPRPQGGPWSIGVQHPRAEGLITTVELTNGAAVTSGDYERFFTVGGVRYCHILDPRTGYPPRLLSSVTILAPDSTIGDMLSTALFVLGPEKGKALLGRFSSQAVFVTPGLDISRYPATSR
jgi:thiamine biosynthesis lipoprotein